MMVQKFRLQFGKIKDSILNHAVMSEVKGAPTLSKFQLAVGLTICILLFCLNSLYLALVALPLVCLPQETEEKETKNEHPSVSSARTLATIYLIDHRLEKAEDLEI